MQFQELKEQAIKLPPRDRLALISTLVESLQDAPVSESDRSGAIQRMRGLLKTDQPAPSAKEVAKCYEERRTEKYV